MVGSGNKMESLRRKLCGALVLLFVLFFSPSPEAGQKWLQCERAEFSLGQHRVGSHERREQEEVFACFATWKMAVGIH